MGVAMFNSRPDSYESELAETALNCIRTGIEASHPQQVIREAVTVTDSKLTINGTGYDLSDIGDVVVVGGGNAAGPVAEALEDQLGEVIDGGAVVTDTPAATDRVELLDGDHPFPSERGVRNTDRIIEIARGAGAHDLVLAVVTGGGSALLASPVADITLPELQSVTESLLECGVTIQNINSVRKHLSDIKGGGLAQALSPARCVGLVFSDVVGNDLAVVASGPTAPDATTYRDAISVIDTCDVSVPDSVQSHLERGNAGELRETPVQGASVFESVNNCVLADANTALHAAADVAQDRGYRPIILSSRVRGEAREAAKTHVAIAEEAEATGQPGEPPVVLLSGGETTVTVRSDGRGGPNQEFCVSSCLELTCENVLVAAVDTDGYDGSTDVAGAIVTDDTIDSETGRRALEQNSTYPLLADANAHVETGETGTNVNDLRVVVVGEDD